ncbi:peptide chain release factor N(5)-glutamine methyltransferase [Rhodoligotrophos ferricapiens]|uniref:peptide chain release factor N(5)-glutamine methyltransferase n=1 Tax=Rhodoligotrophos ferricapiens TaxID=3069264 RepID=UPI00315CB6B7
MTQPHDDAAGRLGDLLKWGRDRLREADIETPELDARLLLLAAAGVEHTALIAEPARALSPDQVRRYCAMIAQRRGGEPVSRILGYREFYGHRFALSPATLDPRPDTETVVERCLQVVDIMGWRHGVAGRSLRLCDLGTGSGAIIISLLHALPDAWGVAVDFSYDALLAARQNASALGVAERLALTCGNWTDAFCGRFDVILSNPPYIETDDIAGLRPEVKCFDPVAALDGGADGLEAYRRIIPAASALLAREGWLILEVGVGQSTQVVELCRAAGFREHGAVPETARDLSGCHRVVSMQLG